MMQHEFKVDGDKVEVTLAKDGDKWILGEYIAQITMDGRILLSDAHGTVNFAHSAKVGDTWWVHFNGQVFCLDKLEPGSQDNDADQGMTAPMPGKILDVRVTNGQSVELGDLLLVMEAMKMEHRIIAAKSGVVSRVNYSVGDQVQQGDVLVEMVE
tara:strand:+ start:377 stop:841 length:465 start_codon:yes stop_codon:yes gene_type:complete